MDPDRALLDKTAEIISAYVGHNSIAVADLPQLIRSVYAALARLVEAGAPALGEAATPAVTVKRSVAPDYIVCLEDGKRFKSLKRHLRTTHKMTPEQYRLRWGLMADYPMVAPSYAAERSRLAKAIGLGRKPQARRRRAAAR
jgi:predicted transcriptional regulator